MQNFMECNSENIHGYFFQGITEPLLQEKEKSHTKYLILSKNVHAFADIALS